ncbi:MAG: DUF4167 domain-containing protein [Rhodobacteraceae bacterium]|nr:DUF4167 domain-containing protein [Paracoccaceae bacterium]
MRSSKSRSRSKSNRNRSVGNIVNRVFDSSGPEGKVRGTPQQIIEKYNQLARDAQLGNDRVSMENFQQHSEHYTRMLGEAQREADARREQQEAQNRDRQRERDETRGQQPQSQHPQQEQPPVEDIAGAPQPQSQPQSQPPAQPQAEISDPMPVENVEGLGEVVDLDTGSDTGLVETPESKPRRPRRPRKPRNNQNVDAPQADAAQKGDQDAAASPDPVVKDAPSSEGGNDSPGSNDPIRPEAAE